MTARLANLEKRLEYTDLPTKETPAVKEKDGAYFLVPHKGVTLNNQPITTEQPLKDGDQVTYLANFLGLKATFKYVFQSDPVKGKADRIAADKAQGKIPVLPDTTQETKDLKWLNERFRADQAKVYVDKKELLWSDINRVLFFKNRKGGDVIAVIKRASEGSYHKTEFDTLFDGGIWDVTFSTKAKVTATIHGVNSGNCAVLAQIIDYYAPMDVIKLFTDMAARW